MNIPLHKPLNNGFMKGFMRDWYIQKEFMKGFMKCWYTFYEHLINAFRVPFLGIWIPPKPFLGVWNDSGKRLSRNFSLKCTNGEKKTNCNSNEGKNACKYSRSRIRDYYVQLNYTKIIDFPFSISKQYRNTNFYSPMWERRFSLLKMNGKIRLLTLS